MGIHTELMLVTPEMARHWLQRNLNNRAVKPSKVLRLAHAIKDGTFRTTHQGVAIFDDGRVADGQHRLSAIVLAGKPVSILVTTGLPNDAADAIDYDIAPRQMHDVFRMKHGNTLLSDRRNVAALRILMQNFTHSESCKHIRSFEEVQDYYERYRFVADPVFTSVANKHDRWGNSYPIAIYITAMFKGGVQLEDVIRFHDILKSGAYDSSAPGEFMAVLCRNMIIDSLGGAWRVRHALSTTRKMQRALYLFSNGDEVSVLREPKELVWQAPGRDTV